MTEAVMRDPAGAVAGRIFAFRDISADRLVEEMKSEFVATVSHELRGPLTSIYGFAETLLREDVLFGEEERQTFLRYIASESERLTTIVDALLNVARLDSGDLHVDLTPTDVRAVVSEVVGSVTEPTSNGHRFVLDLPEAPLNAQADRDKLSQILSALLDNAVKFSPYGGTVTVAARRTGDAVAVTIEDEGVGIPQSEQERIFRKFYRGGDGSTGNRPWAVHRQRSRVGDGRRHRVALGGGQGSQFTFRLPVASEPSPTRAAARLTRVLVIDDEAPIRLLCRVNLEAEGMEVIEANDGPSGLEQARLEKPDVILLDVMMPALDGWRVAEKLVDDDSTHDIPVIFLTARAEFRDRARGLDIGGVDYVTKPFNPLELAPLVRELLARIARGERDELRREKLGELRALMESD